MKDLFIQDLKYYSTKDELQKIGFDTLYLNKASDKYEYKTLKFFGLKAIEANILKQTALSLGSDCAVHRNVILNEDGIFDCLICASKSTFLKIAEKIKLQQFRLKTISEEIIQVFETKEQILTLKNKTFNFSKNKYFMGILNLTPDSFSDGGKFFSDESAKKQYMQLIEDGADIIDIGAQSTRPNYNEISADEEIERLKMILNDSQIQNDNIPKSVDTYFYKVAQFALDRGVDIINDIHGFCDKNMIRLASDAQCPIIVMYNQKFLPESKNDTFSQMYDFFVKKIDELVSNNIKAKNIIIDCGFGFLKNNEQNIEMLNFMQNLDNLKCPVMLGISRKSFLNFISKDTDKDDLSALIAAKYIDNYSIIRVHNIKKHTPLKFI